MPRGTAAQERTRRAAGRALASYRGFGWLACSRDCQRSMPTSRLASPCVRTYLPAQTRRTPDPGHKVLRSAAIGCRHMLLARPSAPQLLASFADTGHDLHQSPRRLSESATRARLARRPLCRRHRFKNRSAHTTGPGLTSLHGATALITPLASSTRAILATRRSGVAANSCTAKTF